MVGNQRIGIPAKGRSEMFGYLRAVGEFSFDTFLAISGTRTVFIQKTWLIGGIGKNGGMQSDIAKSASLPAA